MDSFEWNKIIGAVLGTAIFIFVVRVVAENIYEPEKPAKPGYVVEGVVENPPAAAPPRPSRKPCPTGARCWPRPMSRPARPSPPSAKQCHDLPAPRPTRSARRCLAWWTAPAPRIAGFCLFRRHEGQGRQLDL